MHKAKKNVTCLPFKGLWRPLVVKNETFKNKSLTCTPHTN